jgi:hypothetical protein
MPPRRQRLGRLLGTVGIGLPTSEAQLINAMVKLDERA